MQSAGVVIGFGARPLGDETLLAHLEHRRVRTAMPGRSASDNRWASVAKIDHELNTIERLVTHYQH